MYGLGQSLRGLLRGLILLLALVLIGRAGVESMRTESTEKRPFQSKIFSDQWAEEFHGHDLGCEMGRATYTWRGCGLGSNINYLLNSWVYALAAEGWSDIAIIIGKGHLKELECRNESGGLASHGWSCIFSSMPHLCVFDTPEMWQRHMEASGVSEEDVTEAQRFTIRFIASRDFSTPLEALDIDHIGAKAVMAKYLWSSMTPWLRRDVQAVTNSKEVFQTSSFIAIHVRRGDKLHETHGVVYDAEEYLAAASKYLKDDPTRTPVDEIKGIWVASDDKFIVDDFRSVAHTYFPRVRSEDIVYVASGLPGGIQLPEVVTFSSKQAYSCFVYLMADLEQLAAADVFVGTSSSNMGRLVFLLREGVGKERSSSISMDKAWTPRGRSRSRN